MTVKGIFKILLGTIASMVILSLIVEIINIQVVSLQLNQITKIACKQSAVLFSQETYKERADGAVAGGSVNMNDVLNIDSGTYVDGNFYGIGLTKEQIYNSIYTSNDFKTWVAGPAATKGSWKSIDLISRALNNPSSLAVTLPTNTMASDYEQRMAEYTEAMVAKSYAETMMTPLNMGVPYMDKEVLQKIFKWNLSQLASDCNSNAIRKDDTGHYCVFYKGFRVYADNASISNITYKVLDLEDEADKREFVKITHIDPDKLGYDDTLIKYLGGYAGDDERKRVCIVGFEYSVPVAYEGVTPIKSIFNFVWNNEVEGLDGTQGQDYHYSWNDTTADLKSGGFGEVTTPRGVLPVPGKLIYYVVR